MGDRVGWEGALPMTLVMLLMPVVCYGLFRLLRRYVKTESGVIVEEGAVKVVDEKIEIDVEEGEEIEREEFSTVSRTEISAENMRTSTIELSSRLTDQSFSKDLSIVNNPLRSLEKKK